MADLDLIMSVANLGGADAQHRMGLLGRVLGLVPSFVNVTLVEHIFPERENLADGVIHHLGNPKNIQLIRLEDRKFYNHQHAFNVGALAAKSDNLLFSDIDLIPRPDFYERLCNAASREDIPWAVGWGVILYQDEQGRTARIANPAPMNGEGGINFFRRDFFFDIGGWNDWMGDIAGGDNELARRAESVTKSYNVLNETFCHLWHPVSPVKQKRSKFYENNQEILAYSWRWPEQQVAALKSYPSTAQASRQDAIAWRDAIISFSGDPDAPEGRLFPQKTFDISGNSVASSFKTAPAFIISLARLKGIFRIGYRFRKILPKSWRQGIKRGLQQGR